MAESYHIITGKLCDSGKTQEQLEADPWHDQTIFGVSDTGQTFDSWQTRVTNMENWHYVENLNLYFRSERGSHGWIKAIKTLFTPERWDEIDHILEDSNIVKLLWQGKFARLKKKIQRARAAGMITTAETQELARVFGNGSL